MQPPTTPRKILVIEDGQDIAHLVQLHLRDVGYHVDATLSGTDGLDKAFS